MHTCGDLSISEILYHYHDMEKIYHDNPYIDDNAVIAHH